MKRMPTTSATDIRKNWSKTLDTVSRKKPVMFTRTHDDFLVSNTELMYSILSAYTFSAKKMVESDGSITLSLNEIDLIDNAADEKEAVSAMKAAIMEYAEDYYEEFEVWSAAPNRKKHIPYVLKALLCNDIDELELNIIA